MNPEFSTVIDGKVRPIISAAMQQHLGIRVQDIESDISDRLRQSSMHGLPVNTRLLFRQAKKAFKRAFLLRLLHQHLGNVTIAAAVAGVDRRSIHRMIGNLKLPVESFRQQAQPYEKQGVVKGIIQEVFSQYRPSLNALRYKALSAQSGALSEEIAKELPDSQLSLKEAETAFEREYFSQLLKQCSTIAKAARASGLRYEVVHRKLKSLGIAKPTRAG